MKKVIAVSLTIMMLTAVLHLSVATHYCGGTIADSKISFSGKLASCGMEGNEQVVAASDVRIESHCCDNVVVFCGINSNYFPSFTFVPDSYQQQYQVYCIPAGLAKHSFAALNSIYTSVSPPGAYASTSVELSTICVFRI